MRSLSHPGAELDLCSPAMGFGRLLAWRWPVGLFAWMGSAGLDGTEQHGVLATSAELQVGQLLGRMCGEVGWGQAWAWGEAGRAWGVSLSC